jgi:hypothetical protein
MKTKFYKKHYLVAVYDEDENLVAVCDNAREFAKVFGRTQRDADSILSRIAKRERSYFLHNDEKLFIHFIDLDPNEVREFSMIF